MSTANADSPSAVSTSLPPGNDAVSGKPTRSKKALLTASLPPGDTALTCPQLAAALQVCERTIRRWIAEGKIQAVRRGRTIRIPRRVAEDLVLGTPSAN